MIENRMAVGARTRSVSDEAIRAAVPRQTGGREVRVGVFVVLGIVAAIVVLFVMTDPATLRGRYMLVTEVADAGGIRRGDPVQMRGVNIGRVHGFDMVGERVSIVLEIEGAWQIPADSRARLGGLGLFGGRTMEVVPGASSRMAGPWDTLESVNGSVGVLGSAEVLGEQATRVLGQIEALLSEPTVAAAQGAATELHALAQELRQVVATQETQLADLSASLGRTAAGLETASGAAPDIVRAAARADTAMARMSATTSTLDHAAGLLDEVLGRLDAGEGTLGRLSRDDALYVNLNRAAESIALLATDIRENPRRYLRIGIF